MTVYSSRVVSFATLLLPHVKSGIHPGDGSMAAMRIGARAQFLRSALLGSTLLLTCLSLASNAHAAGATKTSQPQTQSAHTQIGQTEIGHGRLVVGLYAHSPYISVNGKLTRVDAVTYSKRPFAKNRAVTHSGGISCVPYARMVSGIGVGGNAWQWWDNAAGAYARGNRPEAGSVLAFRSNRIMPLGHVAVVSRVVTAREIAIDHANWPRGGGYGTVSRNVAVIDVSDANDWSAVRVELGYGGDFGSVYPVYGFIYDRPDTGIVEASNHPPAPKVELSPAPRDLRPAIAQGYDEVAEAPMGQNSSRRRTHIRARH
jgi:hypothetical protein